MGDRIFSEVELMKMGQRTIDLLNEAIDNKNLEEAKKLGKRMYNEFGGLHDLYINWVTDLMTFIGNRDGEQALSEALEKSVRTFIIGLGSVYANKSLKRKIELLAAGLRGHLQPLEIEEDDEKVCIKWVCGSGGRLVQFGAYNPPRNCHKIKDPQPMTFNRENFPVYCAHCYFQNIIPLGPGQGPLCITEPADRIGEEACKLYIYK